MNLANAKREKLRLECSKLEAEIEATRRSIFKTSSFYTAVSPIVLAILGLLWSWCSGWFDVQRTRVNNEKTLVEAQTEHLKTERIMLERQTAEQRSYVDAMQTELAKLKADRTTLSNQIARLEKDRDEMRSAKDFFEAQATRLAGSETNALRLFGQLQAAQKERNNLSDIVKSLIDTNAALAAYSSNQTAFIVRAEDFASSVWKTILSDSNLRAKLNPLSDQSFRLMLAADAFLPWYQVEPDPDKLTLKTADRASKTNQMSRDYDSQQKLKVLGDPKGL